MKKIAVITGATSGIGKATAEYFAENGYIVYSLARRQADGIKSILTDVTDKSAVDAAIAEIVEAEGRIDVVINNAGFGISGAIEYTPESAARKIFDVNFFGALNVIQAVIPVMRKQQDGIVINVSSAAAPLSLPFQAFYSATKAALSSLTEALRIEVAPFNIRVTSILPGDVKTDFTSKRQKNADDNTVYSKRIATSISKMEHDEQNGMSPKYIAKQIYKLSNRKNPPVYKVGGSSYAFLVGIAKIMPKRLVSFLIGKLYG
ncbi:MAG: SDR family oxidoreductase [Clostridia bacterium]